MCTPQSTSQSTLQAPSHTPAEIVIATFYKFVVLSDYEALQPIYLAAAEERGLRGSLLLAKEGLNATISGLEGPLQSFLAFLREDPRLADLEAKFSRADHQAFKKMKVRLKQEIVALGQDSVDPLKKVGTYVEPADWNALVSQDDVILIDTRNVYETVIGTFKGAVDPYLDRFRDFPEYVQDHLDRHKHKKVAMFCTGGIRCEKASSWMLEQGFENVYHLKGGILKYLEEIPAEESLWQGDCFVFDERVAVDHALQPVNYVTCWGCGLPVSEADQEDPRFEEGASCPACHDLLTDEEKAHTRQMYLRRKILQKA